MIAIIIALVILFLGVVCHLGDRIKKQANNFDTQFKREQEYWARKYDMEFSGIKNRVKVCEKLFDILQKENRIQTMLKKFPTLNEKLLKDAINDITHPNFKESNIESIAEYLHKMVEPFLPKMGSDKSKRE